MIGIDGVITARQYREVELFVEKLHAQPFAPPSDSASTVLVLMFPMIRQIAAGDATATIRGGNIHDMAILPNAFRAKRVVNLHPRDTLRAGDVAGVTPCLVAPAATAALPSRPYPSASSRGRRTASRTWPSAGVSFLPNNLDA